MSINNVNMNTNIGPSRSVNSTLDGSFSGAGMREPVSADTASSWFEALAKAWGNAMDDKAGELVQLSSRLSEGGDNMPSVTTMIQAKAQEFGFLSQAEATSISAIGDGLKAMARKQ